MRTTGRAAGRPAASRQARSAPDGQVPPDPNGQAPPTRTRIRPLTREDVLSAALGIVDQEGAAALSMRRLAQVLQRDPMVPYRHAANKAALLDGMTELVLRQLMVEPTGAPWQAQLRAIARRFRELALAHPNVVPLLVTRPLATPLGLRPLGTLRPLEGVLELLIRAGFAPDDALSTYRALFGFLYGHVLNETQELVDDPEETDDLLRLGLYRLPAREFPRLRSLASALASYDGAAELEHGLDILLDGIQARYAPRERAPGA
jgi:AcrR family transcriptional regulator